MAWCPYWESGARGVFPSHPFHRRLRRLPCKHALAQDGAFYLANIVYQDKTPKLGDKAGVGRGLMIFDLEMYEKAKKAGDTQ